MGIPQPHTRPTATDNGFAIGTERDRSERLMPVGGGSFGGSGLGIPQLHTPTSTAATDNGFAIGTEGDGTDHTLMG